MPIGLTNFLVFVGDDTVFPVPEIPSANRGLRLGDIRDGLVNTILLAQADTGFATEWTRPQDIAYDPQDPLGGVGNIGPEEFYVGFADGHVEAVPNKISEATFHQLVTRNDGLPEGSAVARRIAVEGDPVFPILDERNTGFHVSPTATSERPRAFTRFPITPPRRGLPTASAPDESLVEHVFEHFVEQLEPEPWSITPPNGLHNSAANNSAAQCCT